MLPNLTKATKRRVLVIFYALVVLSLSVVAPSLAQVGQHVHIYQGGTCEAPDAPAPVAAGANTTITFCTQSTAAHTPAMSQSVTWSVNGASFVGTPENTTDSTGEASATVTRAASGTATITGIWPAEGLQASIEITWVGAGPATDHIHLLTAIGTTGNKCHDATFGLSSGDATIATTDNLAHNASKTLYACVHDADHAGVNGRPVFLRSTRFGSAEVPLDLGPTNSATVSMQNGIATFSLTSGKAGKSQSHAEADGKESNTYTVTWTRAINHVHVFVPGAGQTCENHADPVTLLVQTTTQVVACVHGADHDGIADSRSTPSTGSGAQVNINWSYPGSDGGIVAGSQESRTDASGLARAQVRSEEPGDDGNVAAQAVGTGGNSGTQSGDLDIHYECHPLADFFSFDPGFRGGVFVAGGDLDGNGCDEVLVGAGASGGPHVRAFRGNGTLVAETFAYDTGFTGGVRVGAADVDNDGDDELITGPGEGGGPHVKVFDLVDGALTQTNAFFAFDPGFTGGIYVAGGDFASAAGEEIAVGAGSGGGPHVKVMDETGTTLAGFFPFDLGFGGGVRVGAADIDGDALEELLTAAGPGGGPHVRGWSLAGTTFSEQLSFFPYDVNFRGGVYVAGGAGCAFVCAGEMIVTGAGEGGGPHVRVWGEDGSLFDEFFPYDPGFTGGVRVGVGNPNAGFQGKVITGPGSPGGPHIRLISPDLPA